MTIVKKNKKEQFWEVIAPEPFIIDSQVTDEQFISEMITASNADEITELIHEYLQGPRKSFIIYCAENELKKLFKKVGKGYSTKLEKNGKDWLLSVVDEENELIGRGEILPLGFKVENNEINLILEDHLSDFISRNDKGTARIKSLMYKMDMLKNQMNNGNTILS